MKASSERKKTVKSKPQRQPRAPKPKKKPIESRFSPSPITYITVKIEGFNQPKLISALAAEGIRLKNLKKSSQKCLTVRIAKKDSVKTFAICKKLCYNYEVVGRDGLFAYFLGKLSRVGIVLGTLACAAIAFFCGGTITRVEVSGLNDISRADFIATLRENGYGVGAKSACIDRDELRRFVNSMSGVAECSAEVRGNTLIIKVIERDRSEAVRGGKAVVAASDAVITRVVCKSGTPRVKTGDVVKNGATLIEGMLYDGEGNAITEIAADGEVYGTTVTAVTKIVSTAAYRYERTGRKSVKTAVSFGKFFTLGAISSLFDSFESETRSGEIDAFLPLKFTRTEYYETAKIENTATIEEIAEEVRLAAERELTKTATAIKSEAIITEIAEELYEIRVLIIAETLVSAVVS